MRNIEIFYRDNKVCRDIARLNNESVGEAGYYYWFCFPGCLPDSEAIGPFATESEAYDHANDWIEQ